MNDFPFAVPNEIRMPRIEGVMVGIVTNNKDPENLARVKLKLPLREGETETDWVRIATLMAGNERGSLFIPEVGDEVLVAFHLGEVRQPYVIGTLWSSKLKPAPGKNEKNDVRKFKSRAGHELIFDDNDSDGKVTLKTNKGQIVEMMDKDSSIKIADSSGNQSVLIKGGSANEITISAGTSKIMMNAKGDIQIESTKEIKVKSTQLNLEASATMELKAGASINMKSDGIINIKGSMVKIN
ncbi:phage baseplate assembly protein V [Paenibacillus sp. GD4]|uniref:phage baseplate assembly protein V n=1 Tax=Paenibacillus sp. GD4 TaxID=3068890 RepID=UPI0027967292|nr:phage baseplate assembly protein V [Paenibacillus sp. GD4]MDQ1909558.1 phage baseplate assembly protein V [Paenibacillus sp. GD4]